MSGEGFDLIPNDAVLVTSDDNNRPLAHRDATGDVYVASILSKTATEIVFATGYTGSYSSAQYAGAILSDDRQTVYWVNETRPLP